MSKYIPVALQKEIRLLDKDCCAYCQSCEFLMGITYEIDHIIPISKGGTTTIDNLCLACPMCNRYKSNYITVKDPLTNKLVALFHPRKQTWHNHFAWDDSYTTIMGLTSTGRATIECLRVNRPKVIQLRKYWIVLELHPPK